MPDPVYVYFGFLGALYQSAVGDEILDGGEAMYVFYLIEDN